ncbi:transposase [Halococcus morrhuae]
MALADAGYWSKANAQLADEQTELFIATTKDWKRRKELREADPPRGRIPKWYGLKERMERKLRTKRGRGIYRKRSQSVEAVFGQHVTRGCDRFLLRGETGAQAEWSLFSATHNLLVAVRPGAGRPRSGGRDRPITELGSFLSTLTDRSAESYSSDFRRYWVTGSTEFLDGLDSSDNRENSNSGDARTDSNNDGSSGEQPHTVKIAGHTFEIPDFLADLSLKDAKTAIKGAFFGQTGMRDGWRPVESANSVFYILGQIAGSFVPTLGSIADARDAVQDAANGKLGTAALSAAGAIPGLAKLTEGKLAIRHLKNWKASFGGEMAGDLKTLGQLIVNHVGPYMPNSVVKKALDVTADGAASTLKKEGFTMEQITEFSKDGNLEMMAEASESGLKLSPESTNFKRVSRLRNMDVPAKDVVWYVENDHSLKRVEQLVNAGFSPEAINDVYKQGSRGMEGVDWYSKANDYCSVQASLEPANRNHTSMCDLLPTQ